MIDITDDKGLAELCERAATQEFIAFDTEFIREKTFFPILALLQISWQDCDPVLVDPLTIKDWTPFHRLLKDPAICKIFHAGRQDLEIFYHQTGEVPRNLFDTQIAASMCGYGEQIGYSALVSRVLKVQLTKGSSYTNWLQRPLTKAQLRYARDDVAYLPDLYRQLIKKAAAKKRLDWILEETNLQLSGQLFDPDPDQLWRKVKRAGTLRGRHLAVLQALTRWRYHLARELNRPVRFLASDEVLIELAKVEHLTLEALSARRGIQPRFIERHGDDMIKCHAAARTLPADAWPSLRDSTEAVPSEKSEALADLAWLLLKETARKADISATHLIGKKELAVFIETRMQDGDLSAFPISSGWRRRMVGASLVELLEGRLVIKVKNQQIVWEALPVQKDP